MNKLFSIVLVLMCFGLNNNSQLESLDKNFYNSESFLNTISKVSNKDSLISLININNNSFVKVDKAERLMYRNKKDFKKNLKEVRNLFHVFTDYYYYDYRSYNEFELRRKKNEHKKITADKSIVDKNFFIRLDFNSSVLSEYDFDNNNFSIPVRVLAKNRDLNLQNISYDFKLPEGYGLGDYYLQSIFNNLPDELIININDLDKAEAFSKKSVTLILNFKLADNIAKEYNYSDKSTPFFDAVMIDMKKAMLSLGKDWIVDDFSNERKVKLFHSILDGKFLPRDYANAFDRDIFFEVDCKIQSIELLSSVIGNYIWKPDDWHQNESILKRINQIKEERREIAKKKEKENLRDEKQWNEFLINANEVYISTNGLLYNGIIIENNTKSILLKDENSTTTTINKEAIKESISLESEIRNFNELLYKGSNLYEKFYPYFFIEHIKEFVPVEDQNKNNNESFYIISDLGHSPIGGHDIDLKKYFKYLLNDLDNFISEMSSRYYYCKDIDEMRTQYLNGVEVLRKSIESTSLYLKKNDIKKVSNLIYNNLPIILGDYFRRKNIWDNYTLKWDIVHSDYIIEIESKFNQFIMNDRPLFKSELLNWALGEPNGKSIGVYFYDTKERPTVRAIGWGIEPDYFMNAERVPIPPNKIPSYIENVEGGYHYDPNGNSQFDVGDVITHIDGVVVNSTEDLLNEIGKKERGQTISVTVKNKANPITISEVSNSLIQFNLPYAK